MRPCSPVRAVAFGAALAAVASPLDLVAQSGLYDVLVSSNQTHSIKRFDGETGVYLGDFVPPRSGGLAFPQEILPSPDGHFYVSGFGTASILKFHGRTGSFMGTFSSGYVLNSATKMVYGPGDDVYVSQWSGQSTVVRFDGDTGAFVEEVTPSLVQPMQPAWSSDGTLHVVNFGSVDVRRFDDQGQLLDVFTAGGPLTGPVNLWFEDSYLYVVDWRGGTVERYDRDTADHIDTFISGLSNAEGWDYGPDGRLYIADWGAGLVNAYDSVTGAFEEVFITSGGLQEPNSVLFFERLPDYDVALASSQVSVSAGQSGQLQLTITPDRGLAFDDLVDLGCRGLPAATTCTFSPPSVSPGASGTTSMLTIDVSSGAVLTSQLPLPDWDERTLPLLLAVCAVVLVARMRRGELRRPRLGCAFVLVALMGACGDATGPPESETRSVTVDAVSGEIQKSVTFTLTVSR